jgi:hypothetical protein
MRRFALWIVLLLITVAALALLPTKASVTTAPAIIPAASPVELEAGARTATEPTRRADSTVRVTTPGPLPSALVPEDF